jgi:hypothetical protein
MEDANRQSAIMQITPQFKALFLIILGVVLIPLILAFMLVVVSGPIVEGTAASDLMATCMEITKTGFTSLFTLVVGKGTELMS